MESIDLAVREVMKAAKGMSAHWFATRVGNSMQRGTNFTGCGKENVARTLLEGGFACKAHKLSHVLEQVQRAWEDRRLHEERKREDEEFAERRKKAREQRFDALAKLAKRLRAVGIESAQVAHGCRTIELSEEDAARLLDDRTKRRGLA